MSTLLTFGVEIETVFMFHEQKLRSLLDGRPETAALKICKNLGDIKRKGAMIGPYVNTKYNSWGLLDPTEDAVVDLNTLVNVSGQHIAPKAYTSQPFELAEQVMSTIPARKSTTLITDRYSKSTEYNWTLMYDNSVSGLRQSDLKTSLPSDRLELTQVTDWDSYGIAQVLDAFKGTATSKHAITTTEATGLHVHVGLPGGERFPIETLRNLALILLTYEDELALLHPISRRTDNPELSSNRVQVYNEDDTNPVSRNGAKYLCSYMPIQEIRDRIDKADHAQLVELMGAAHRHAVNFSYTARKVAKGEGAATIEFRQHAGTLDPEEIYHWVQHCLALVRLASTSAGRVKTWDDKIALEDLWEDMALPEGTLSFLRARKAAYAAEWPEWEAPAIWTAWEEYPEDDWSDE
ncbi:hypothetical protein H2203_000244 [Taxawa tesnikishii (nom. ined.)]|nr:hypothetical protein H2203_000244 [Dothideales sp. JES 119]